MSYVWEWVRNVTLIIILFSFIEILLPGSRMSKYIKFIFSLTVLAMMLSPLSAAPQDMSVWGNMPVSGLPAEEKERSDSQPIERTQTKQIEEVYLEKLTSQLTEELKGKFSGISITSVEIYINNEVHSKGFGTPERAEISITDPEYEKVVSDYVSDRLQIEKRSVTIALTEE